jgi:hypothetical protein
MLLTPSYWSFLIRRLVVFITDQVVLTGFTVRKHAPTVAPVVIAPEVSIPMLSICKLAAIPPAVADVWMVPTPDTTDKGVPARVTHNGHCLLECHFSGTYRFNSHSILFTGCLFLKN